jgi:outer membrane immunogenic protein
VEGDWAWADRTRTLNGSIYPAPAVLGPPNTGSSYAVRTTWDASARARLGFLVTPTILFYATGGASWIHAETTSTCSTAVFAPCGGFGGLLDPFAPGVTSHASTRLGWTLGGGFEAQLWGNWLARAEYRFADYGTWSSTDVRTCPPAGGLICFAGPVGSTLTVVNDVRLRTHTAAFGLAYKF